MNNYLFVGGAQIISKIEKHKNILEDKDESKKKYPKSKGRSYSPKKVYKAVVPKYICFDSLIREYPIRVKRKFKYEFQLIDRIAGFLDIILRKYNDSYKFMDFSKDVYISSANTFKPYLDNYNDILDFLIISNVIEIVQEDEIGVNTRSYRLTEEYRNEGTRYYFINDKNIIAKLNNRRSHKPSIERYPVLYKYVQELCIDKVEALKEAEKMLEDDENKVNKMSLFRIAFDNINSSTPSFKKDKSSGRLHTSITNLKKEFRQFLRYKGEPLVELDIKCSQPYFLACLLKAETWENFDIVDIILTNSQYLSKEDILDAKRRLRKNTQFSSSNRLYIDSGGSMCSLSKYLGLSKESIFFNSHDLIEENKEEIDFSNFNGSYSELVASGMLYEFISWNLGFKTRDEGKNQMFNILFNPPKFKSEGRFVFEKHFPEIIEFADTINKGYERTKKQGRTKAEQSSTLALLLQTLEAEFILDSLVLHIQENFPELPIFTIHDSILNTPGYEEKVKVCIEEYAVRVLGLLPMLKVG